jgi:hypothetical protein
MYYYHFDDGTVYLPSKKHFNIPVIVSNYAHDTSHWPKRVEEDTRVAANKAGLGLVVFRSRNITHMVNWVALKPFAHPKKIGVLTLGLQRDMEYYCFEMTSLAFKIVALAGDCAVDLQAYDAACLTPMLVLQGSGGKVSLDAETINEENIIRTQSEKSSAIRFGGSDDFLYNASRQAAGEIITWVKGVTA